MRNIVFGGIAAFLAFFLLLAGIAGGVWISDRQERRAIANRMATDLARVAQITEKLASGDTEGAMRRLREEALWRNNALAELSKRDRHSLDDVRPTLQGARRTFAYLGDPELANVLDWETAPVDKARHAFEQGVLRPKAMAPELSVSTWLGDGRSLADLRGKVVLLDFWATYCAPCVAGMAKVAALQDEFREQGFVVLTVHQAGDGAEVERFVRDRSLHLPVGIDTGRTFSDYGVRALPTKVIIDRQGRVTWSPDMLDPSRRAMTPAEAAIELRGQVERALAE